MYNPNDPNMYNPYPYQMPTDPEMPAKHETSEDDESDTDSDHESPTNSFNNDQFIGAPMAQSTPAAIPRPNLQVNQGPFWPTYPVPIFGGQQKSLYPGMYDNQVNSVSDDSGNGSMMMIKPNFQVSEMPTPDNKIPFCQVPGRLSLLGCNKKLVVTLAEIRRRINPPECLNQSILSAILRKAKNKDGGNKLNQQLKQHNITLAQGRRKSAPNSAFTALCETESLTLAQDFHGLSERHFPFNSVIYEILCMIPDYYHFEQKKSMYSCAFYALIEITGVIRNDRSPLIDMVLDPPLSMHTESQKDFTNFSLLTHGFGVPGHVASWSTALKLIKAIVDAMGDPRAFFDRIQRPSPEWVHQIPYHNDVKYPMM